MPFRSAGRLHNPSQVVSSMKTTISAALKHNFKVIHITENSFFDLYHSFIWPSIDLNFINEKIVKYKIKNFDSILFNKENNIFNKYLLR